MPVALQTVDSVDVTILIDNAIDILAAPDPVARRQPLPYEFVYRDQLRAEHGYSLVITVRAGERSERFLYDAGLGKDTAVHNLDHVGINPKDFRGMVLSHGHADHHAGLEGLFERLRPQGMPLILHPDVWRDRKVVFPNGHEIHLPAPSLGAIEREGWTVVEERGPTLMLEGLALVTGQVERTTEYERGFPLQHARTADGQGWEPDTWIWDDQGVIVNVRGRGLVVMSSCSHAGAINVIRNARRLTGESRILAFIGGMHLTGGLFEQIIPQTIADLVAIGPEVVVPGHCTGWRAAQAVATALPAAYIHSNVGTTLHFEATG